MVGCRNEQKLSALNLPIDTFTRLLDRAVASCGKVKVERLPRAKVGLPHLDGVTVTRFRRPPAARSPGAMVQRRLQSKFGNVCFPSKSDHGADVPEPLKCANSRHHTRCR
jgi:hypothetical protein